MKAITMKICTKCKETKDESEFHKHCRNKDGLQSQCKICTAAYQREYRQPEVGKVAYKKYFQSERGKAAVKAAQAKYRKKYFQSDRGKEVQKRSNEKYYSSLRGNLRGRYYSMIRRCSNHLVHNYKSYGGRGIKVLFESFDSFYNYIVYQLGYDTYDKIKGLQIDRINTDGNYEEGNIRFVTAKVNANNRRKGVIV